MLRRWPNLVDRNFSMSDIWECSAREFLPGGGAIETEAGEDDEVATAAAEAEVDLLKICAEPASVVAAASNCFSLSGGLFS